MANNNTVNLQAFYQSIGGTGRHLYDLLFDEYCAQAAEYGLDWSTIDRDLKWDGSKVSLGKRRYFTTKGEKSASVRADYKTSPNGIEFPVISIARRGESTAELVFNGYEDLKRHFELAGGEFRPNKDWRQRQQQRLDARREREAAALARAQAEQARRELARQEDVARYHRLPDATDHPYLRRKQVWGSLPHCRGIKQGQDKNGHFLAIPLFSASNLGEFMDPGPVVGVQRIYAGKFARHNGELTDKDFTFGLDKVDTAAYTLIGDLAGASRLYICEGWATGASAFLAHQQHLLNKYGPCAVIVCLDAGQLLVVLDQLLGRHPDLETDLVNLVDNDCWKAREGKGNKGMATALEIATRYPRIRHQLPDVSEADAVDQPTDFNDVATGHRAGLKEVARQISSTEHRLDMPRDLFELALLRLPLVPRDLAQRETMKAISFGMRGFPFVRSGRQILAALKAVIEQHQLPVDWPKLAWLANKIRDEKLAVAHGFRSFSARITDPELRPDYMRYYSFSQTTVDDDVYRLVSRLQGLVIIRAPMASGKTKHLIRPLMWQSERAASFVHRVTLVDDGHTKLTKLAEEDEPMLATMPADARDILHYKDAEMATLSGMKKLACCINSINKPHFSGILQRLDLLALDEASQMLRSITNGGTMTHPLAVYNRLKACAAQAGRVLLVDADANDSVVEFAERVREQRGDQLPIHVIELATDCSDKRVLYGELNAVFTDIIDKVGLGKRVLVADDSAEEGMKLARALTEKYPHTRGLFISQDSKTHDENVQQFNADPDAHVRRYDWVVYSPAISSGVSIVTRHFDHHYGLFRGVISPSDAVQMIRRDRTASTFTLGLTSPIHYRETDQGVMWRATLAGLAERTQDLQISWDHQTGQLQVGTDNMEFDRLRISLLTTENAARNDFANTMLLQLMADRYDVQPLDLACPVAMTEQAKEVKKRVSALLKQEDIDRHLQNPTATDEQRQELNQRAHISQDERAQLNRWNIENLLRQPVDPDSICWLRDGALSHVKRYELLQMPSERAKALDDGEHKAGLPTSTRQYLAHSQKLLRRYLETAGIDWRTGQGQASQQQLNAALKLLQDNADFLSVYAPWCPPVRNKRRGGDLFKAILENLNLEPQKTRLARRSSDGGMVWSIAPGSWEQMATIHQQRTQAGISAFEDIQLAPASGKAVPAVDQAMIHDFGDDLKISGNVVDQRPAPVPVRPAGVSYLLGRVGARLKLALHDVLAALSYEEKVAVRDGKLDENGVMLALGAKDPAVRAKLPPVLVMKLVSGGA